MIYRLHIPGNEPSAYTHIDARIWPIYMAFLSCRCRFCRLNLRPAELWRPWTYRTERAGSANYEALTGCWFGTFFHLLGTIIPTDELLTITNHH